jgi:hypothetical protein
LPAVYTPPFLIVKSCLALAVSQRLKLPLPVVAVVPGVLPPFWLTEPTRSRTLPPPPAIAAPLSSRRV